MLLSSLNPYPQLVIPSRCFTQSEIKSTDPGLWYLLAETQGLAGNIIGLHESRAEFFILNGNLDQAEKLSKLFWRIRNNQNLPDILKNKIKLLTIF